MPEKFVRHITVALLIALFPIIAIASSTSYDDINILSSNDNGITFELNIKSPNKYITSISGDSVYSAVRTVLIGLPHDAEPFIKSASSNGIIAFDISDGKKLRSSSKLAEIVDVKLIRGRKVATANIYPYYRGWFQKDIEVSINFEYPDGRSNQIISISKDKIFESIYQQSILNYNQFKRWPTAVRVKAGKAAQSPFTVSQDWYKIQTTNERFIRISGQNLSMAGISLDNLASDSIHIFYGGGEPIPDRNSDPVNSFEEISIMVEDNGDGYFNRDDYILFFAEGADRWRYPVDSSPVYLENHYTNTNYYWLTVSGDFAQGGRRISLVNGAPSGSVDTTITAGRFNRRIHQNNMLSVDSNDRIRDYFNWYWTGQAHFTFYESLPNVIPGATADITVRAISNPTNYIFVNSSSAASTGSIRPRYFFTTDDLVPGLNRFSLVLDSSTTTPPYFDYCEISYIGELIPSNDILDFFIGGFNGTGEIILDNQFNGIPLIFDLSDSKNPVRVTNALVSSAEINFRYNLSPAGPNRFYVCPISKAISPNEIEKIEINDLRENISQTDMMVIAPEILLPYLEDYETYREEKSDINVKVVSFDQILDQFSYGLYDPKAIREFLKFSFENYEAPAPSAVLLIGDGVYDFENNLGLTSTNIIPPYIQKLDSSASDDNYVFFGDFGLLDSDTSYTTDRGYDMMISRWPVKTISELATIIDKVKTYEASTNYGPWRTTITLVADDEFGHYETEWFHTSQTEELQEPPRLPSSFRRNKIYLWDYPFNSTHRKPLVNEAIVKSFNEGTLLINYVGHGNPDSWAHENVFHRSTDLINLTNSEKLTLVVTASCSIGFFDNPDKEGMAEDLIRYANGGAIGVISATRLVYSSDNSAFNKQIFEILFGENDLSIAQAFYTAKLIRQYGGVNPVPIRNDRKYIYFGDPFVRLGVPKYEIKFIEKPDSLTALEYHQASGEIVEKSSGAHIDFNGSIELFVYDSNIEKKHKVIDEDGDSVKTVTYDLNGPAIYRGNTDVVDGYFNFSFMAPLDMGVGGNTAKVSGYGIAVNSDALGLVDSIPVSLSIISSEDAEGPVIDYTFGQRVNFLSGDKITSGETMTLTIFDSSGVNLTGSLGHEITLVIDDRVENTANLTDLFQYNTGSYLSGTIEYEIGSLPTGIHSFRVKAWDNANNSTLVEFEAEILADGEFMVTDLMNYPNPMRESTVFSFSLTSPADRVDFEIFTLSGRKIKSIYLGSVPSGYNEFYSWQGDDADYDRIATGIYIYKVTAVSEWYEKTVESFGKVVLIN